MTVVIWISSFIPKSIPNVTRPVPGQIDKTMIKGILKCYYTDQRSFEPDPAKSARTQLLVELAFGQAQPIRAKARCSPTTEVHCDTGAVTCIQEPDDSKLKVENFRVVSPTRTTFSFTGGANNPCITGSPDIDWLVHVVVDKRPNGVLVALAPGSVVEPFPAFECYARFNNVTKAVFTRPPNPGAGPDDLYGDPDQAVAGSATFP